MNAKMLIFKICLKIMLENICNPVRLEKLFKP